MMMLPAHASPPSDSISLLRPGPPPPPISCRGRTSAAHSSAFVSASAAPAAAVSSPPSASGSGTGSAAALGLLLLAAPCASARRMFSCSAASFLAFARSTASLKASSPIFIPWSRFSTQRAAKRAVRKEGEPGRSSTDSENRHSRPRDGSERPSPARLLPAKHLVLVEHLELVTWCPINKGEKGPDQNGVGHHPLTQQQQSRGGARLHPTTRPPLTAGRSPAAVAGGPDHGSHPACPVEAS